MLARTTAPLPNLEKTTYSFLSREAECWLTSAAGSQGDLNRDFVQTNILDSGPDNGQAIVLSGKDVDLIGALPHIALPDSQWHW